VLDGDPAPPPQQGAERQKNFGPFLLRSSGWLHQDATWYGGRPQPRGLCVTWGFGTQPAPQKGRSPQFSAHICCGQTAAWIKMPLCTEVGLGPGDIVLDGDPAPSSPRRGWSPLQFSAYVYRCQTPGWIKMTLGMAVGLGPGHIVLNGDPAPLPQKGGRVPLNFGPFLLWPNGWMHQHALGMEVGLSPGDFVLDGIQPCLGLLWPNGWMDQDVTWYRGKPRPRRRVRRGRSSPPPKKRHSFPVFGSCLLWPNGWMDEDATWYGTNGSRSRPRPHCIRRGPAPRERGTAGPLFSAHVYCGHGRPSQLLLSSCHVLQRSSACKVRWKIFTMVAHKILLENCQ